MAPSSTRRDVLRLGAAALAWAAGPARADAGLPVVIVGAGLAGLRTAALLRPHMPVLVLEASERPGGRVRSLSFDDGLVAEAGAARIANTHDRVLALVRAHRLPLTPFEPPPDAGLSSVLALGDLRMPSDRAAAIAAERLHLAPAEQGRIGRPLLDLYLDDLPEELAAAGTEPVDLSRWQALDAVSWPVWLAARGASADAVRLLTAGGDSRGVSALYILRQLALHRQTRRYYKIAGGLEQLPRAMAAELGGLVRTGVPVTGLQREGAAVRVLYREDGAAASVLARRVVLTLPPPLLRDLSGAAAWPADKRRAVAELDLFASVRALVQTRSRFWLEDGLSGFGRTDRPAELWDVSYGQPGTRGLLAATAGGAIGRGMATVPADAAERAGVDLIADAYPGVRAAAEAVRVVRWSAAPWARGGFARYAPGQMAGLMPVLARAEGPVHFAGEHTSPFTSWMEGALRSGERAAAEVLQAEAAGTR
jgi:monoamine oxidase